MKSYTTLKVILIAFLLWATSLSADPAVESVKVGLASVLSGDLAILGKNATATIETYRKHFLRHNIDFKIEDARLSSREGLQAYQSLINLKKVDLILAACSSNGSMAAKKLVNNSKTLTFSISTGGPNIDAAGPWFFRIGNSDRLNGIQQADYFIQNAIKKVALLSEETEYTQDIAIAFRKQFLKLGGKLIYDNSFLPGTIDFRSEAARIAQTKPEAIFMPTQTGTALGIFIKQLHRVTKNNNIQIHTTFVAAPNPDAHTAAGKLINGTYYMDPEYDAQSDSFKEFLKYYREDHDEDPPIAFHAAGIVDALNHLQNYLDQEKSFSKTSFRDYLLTQVKEYCGLMGCYSFDEKGNTAIGFRIARIVK